MKKILLGLFAVTLAASLCFAGEGSAQGRLATFIGIVDSVSNRDNVSKENPQIIIKDLIGKGMGTAFTVERDAIIISKVGHAANLDWVNRGDEVTIEYITAKDGTKVAKSIKVADGW